MFSISLQRYGWGSFFERKVIEIRPGETIKSKNEI